MLGNRTTELIDGSRGNPLPLNAVVRSSQRLEQERQMSTVEVESLFRLEDGQHDELESTDDEEE